MAVDEALLESAVRPGATATLRLYHFRRPTVTFGYAQDLSQTVNETACRDANVDCVRRITGGRALLHGHDLTYSVSAPPLARSVKTTYQSVSGAVRRALARLGVPLDPPRVPSESRATPAGRHLPCLAVPTSHEITTGGRKVVASAMRFRRRGFLTHGSILWTIDRPLSRRVTGHSEHDALPAVGIREVELDGPEFDEAELANALSVEFEQLLGASAVRGALSPEESARASLLTEKYRSEGWTRGGRVRSRLVDNTETVW